MDTSTPVENSFFETLDASSSSASSIHLEWEIDKDNIIFVEGYRVHYQKVASKHIHYGPILDATDTEYEIENLVADTYYKVCLLVMRNGSIPFRECVDASTTNWQLPVSVGSSIGAILALSMIVLIVLLSRCHMPLKYGSKKGKRSQKYDTISSNYHDEQFDFSETATHGQDDDFTSDDDALYEIQVGDSRRTSKGQYLVDRPSLTNGISRSHVHPHSYYHSQHRNSLSRIPLTQSHHHHNHHHSRQMRAYSMHAVGNTSLLNHLCSPLAKEARKYTLERGYSQQSADIDQVPLHPTPNPYHTSTGKDIISSVKGGQPNAHKTSSPSHHAFSFIDEVPDAKTKTSTSTSKSNDSFITANKSSLSDNLLITDIDFEDMSQYGASGGVLPDRQFTSPKTMEMTSTNNTNMFAVPESLSFDEHSV